LPDPLLRQHQAVFSGKSVYIYPRQFAAESGVTPTVIRLKKDVQSFNHEQKNPG